MKKQFKRSISKFLLCVLFGNIIIVPDTKAMGVPVAVAVPVAEALMAAGECMAMLGAYIYNKASVSEKKEDFNVGRVGDFFSASRIVVTVAADAKKKVEEERKKAAVIGAAEAMIKGKDLVDNPVAARNKAYVGQNAQSKVVVEGAEKIVSANIASQELAQIVQGKLLEGCPAVYTPIPFVPKIFEATSIPGGMQIQIPALSGFKASLQFSDKGAENEARFERLKSMKEVLTMRHLLKHNASYKKMVVADTRVVVECLALTQSDDLAESIPACLALDKLYIQCPLNERLSETVRKVRNIYFEEGQLNDKAFLKNTEAAHYIADFVNDVERITDHAITKEEIISSSLYDWLKSIKKTKGEKSSFRYSPFADLRHLNDDVLSCLAACQQYDFTKAEVFRARYEGNKIFEKLINKYKNKHEEALKKAQKSLYGADGIVNAVKGDPAYMLNEAAFRGASDEQKKAINENLLFRHHLKNLMHEKWGISKNAPACVHEALYNIMGANFAAVADIASLQHCIEDIIKAAPENERDVLVKAFYLPNGVLKEFAHHSPSVKNIKMPSKILMPTYDILRQQLNDLICEDIKSPEKAQAIKTARGHLYDWIAAKNSKDAIESKGLFEKAYTNVFNSDSAIGQSQIVIPAEVANAPGKPQEVDGYVPPKNWDGKKVRNPNGPGYGWPDKKGNVWIPSGPDGHGGPHWDVQKPNGDYDNVLPGGKIRGQK